ncbi:hypothetical protein RvY_08611 [Ramazzottius varieornatus]|uniref:Protein kinase domain-containing protein n=1 Tax=Ramazzottius varieornatus TaxID=947166 RepID=A0A1D1VFN9_RAMVA|nr:hypothetical protein RvY_08611 [Ramazzottius varieornatus]
MYLSAVFIYLCVAVSPLEATSNTSDLMSFGSWTFGIQTTAGDNIDLNYSLAQDVTDQLQLRCFTHLCTKRNLDCNAFYLVSPASFSFLHGNLSLHIKLPAAGSPYSSIQLWPFRCRSSTCPPGNTTYITFELFRNTPYAMYYTLHYVGSSGTARTERLTSQRPRTSPEPFYTIGIISTADRLSWWFDGSVVASFTNHLSLPKEPMFFQLVKSCSSGGMESIWNSLSVMTIDSIKYQESEEPSRQEVLPSPERNWKENYHNQIVTMQLMAYDNDISVYFDENTVDDNERSWIFTNIGPLWRHAKQQYGSQDTTSKPSPRLIAAFHSGKNEGCKISSQKLSDNNPSAIQYVLDCKTYDAEVWNDLSPLWMEQIASSMAVFAANYAHDIAGNPASAIDGSAVQSIILFDFYMALRMNEDAKKVVQNATEPVQDAVSGPSWFRDWYLPLYYRFNGSELLSRYFLILSENFPSSLDSQGVRRYTRNMTNVGEFVHFWSGAAGADLRDFYKLVFGSWSAKDEESFKDAQRTFPKLRYSSSLRVELDSDITEQNVTGSGGKARASVIAPAVVVPVVVVLLVGSVIFYHCRKRTKSALRRHGHTQKMEKLGPQSLSQETEWAIPNAYEPYGLLLSDEIRRYIIPRENLHQSSNVLGSGQYGTVYTATATGLYGRVGTVPLAAKVLTGSNPGNSDPPTKLFEREVNVMLKAGQHLNIVNLLGIVLDEYPTLLMELCEFGSLLNYLQQCRPTDEYFANLVNTDGEIVEQINDPRRGSTESAFADTNVDSERKLSTTDLVSFAYQISRGLEYLASRSIIHRDIAARNILVSKYKIAKVADFGMARWSEVDYMTANASQAQFPVRWMSPEALLSLSFSESTDVWSYGVLLWEIFSLGETPYRGIIVSISVKEFVKWLADGNQLERPQYCPNVMYDIMKTCWNLTPSERPCFKDLRASLETFISSVAACQYLQLNNYYKSFDLGNEEA